MPRKGANMANTTEMPKTIHDLTMSEIEEIVNAELRRRIAVSKRWRGAKQPDETKKKISAGVRAYHERRLAEASN